MRREATWLLPVMAGNGEHMSIHGGARRKTPLETNKQRENDQTVMESRHQVYHDVEDKEGYLVVKARWRVRRKSGCAELWRKCIEIGAAAQKTGCTFQNLALIGFEFSVKSTYFIIFRIN
jgi:hypothetical protein